MSVRTLVEEFTALEDPRCGGKIEHRLIDILMIAVCAVIAGAESWEDIALDGRSKIGWLGTFLALPNGILAHDTFRRAVAARLWPANSSMRANPSARSPGRSTSTRQPSTAASRRTGLMTVGRPNQPHDPILGLCLPHRQIVLR
jgi:DDE_Tnp_1-associated